MPLRDLRMAGGMEGTKLLTTIYTPKGRTDQHSVAAWDVAMLPKYQDTDAHTGDIPVQVLPLHPESNQTLTVLCEVPWPSNGEGYHQTLLDPGISHSQTESLKQMAPVLSSSCSSWASGSFLEQPLLQTTAWRCWEPLPALTPGTGKLRIMCHWKVLNSIVLKKHDKLKHSYLLPVMRGDYLCPRSHKGEKNKNAQASQDGLVVLGPGKCGLIKSYSWLE